MDLIYSSTYGGHGCPENSVFLHTILGYSENCSYKNIRLLSAFENVLSMLFLFFI